MTIVQESALTARPASRPTAAASAPSFQLRQLDWDTQFFGARCGTITPSVVVDRQSRCWTAATIELALRVALDEARLEKYAHLILRTASDDFATIWAAESAGLRLVDIGVDSSRDPHRVPLPSVPEAISIRTARQDDEPVLRELAAEAFTLSRFSADPFFTAVQVEEFHRTWVTNLCRGLAQQVLVCVAEGHLVGFVTCAVAGDEGRIPLIATSAPQRARGLGSALVGAALIWFRDAGCRVVHVKTQAHNYRALALYHRSGFTTSNVELTFSIALGLRSDKKGSY